MVTGTAQTVGLAAESEGAAAEAEAEAVDIEMLRAWVGRTRQDEDTLGLRQAQLMAATVDYAPPTPLRDGSPLPPLWHWLYFLEGLPERELGRDGHPARGGFLPPVPLPNRMWAGGRIDFLAPLCIGEKVRRISRIRSVEHKRGRSGALVFVTVEHLFESVSGAPLLREEHDIVFRSAERVSVPSVSEPAAALPPGARIQTLKPSTTTLFRYSALTFNGHRIHYDADYCRAVEGYGAPVIHGPLNATLMAGLAASVAASQGQTLRRFSYRGLRPALLGETLQFVAWPQGDMIAVETRVSNGAACMRGEAGTEASPGGD